MNYRRCIFLFIHRESDHDCFTWFHFVIMRTVKHKSQVGKGIDYLFPLCEEYKAFLTWKILSFFSILIFDFSSPVTPHRLIDACLHAVQLTISYLLMLVFMTFNVWLCVATVCGEVRRLLIWALLEFFKWCARATIITGFWNCEWFCEVGGEVRRWLPIQTLVEFSWCSWATFPNR